MSQIADMTAINAFFNRLIPTGKDAIRIKAQWATWYKNLSWYDKNINGESLKHAAALRDAYNRVQVITVNRPTLRLGATGNAVNDWQRILGIRLTGTFDRNTKVATQTWQRSRKLVADGVVGKNTWGAVGRKIVNIPKAPKATSTPPKTSIASVSQFRTLKIGMNGSDVVALQKLLGIASDGKFGRDTHAAVVAFQKSKGLKPDGIVGKNTRAMFADGIATTPVDKVVKTVAKLPKAAATAAIDFPAPTWAKVAAGAAVAGIGFISIKNLAK